MLHHVRPVMAVTLVLSMQMFPPFATAFTASPARAELTTETAQDETQQPQSSTTRISPAGPAGHADDEAASSSVTESARLRPKTTATAPANAAHGQGQTAVEVTGLLPWEHGAPVDLPNKAAFTSWISPDVRPWASILAVHGLGFNKETYSQFGRRMARIGVAVYALDVRGFGTWKEENHKKLDFEATFSDIQQALAEMRKRAPERPIFMLGESMGGSMALQATARYPELVDGVISSVPSYNDVRNLGSALKIAAIGLTHGPNGRVDITKTVIDRSSDKASVRQDLIDSPGNRKYLRVRDLIAYRKFMFGNRNAERELVSSPVLMLQGFRDRLIGPRATTKLFNHIKVNDKDLVIVGNAEHLIFEEGQFSDDTIDTVVSWIHKHSYGGAPVALLPSQISKEKHANLVQLETRERSSIMPSKPGSLQFLCNELRVARAYSMAGQSAEAQKHYQLAMELGRGSLTEEKFNQRLKLVPRGLLTPLTGQESFSLASSSGLGEVVGKNGKATIVSFYAPWVKRAEEQSAVRRIAHRFGNQVNFVRLDVSQPKYRTIADQYGIAVLPAALVLDRNMQVVGYVEGNSDATTAEIKVKEAMQAQK